MKVARFRSKPPLPNCASSFGFVTTTPGVPGVSAGVASLGIESVSSATAPPGQLASGAESSKRSQSSARPWVAFSARHARQRAISLAQFERSSPAAVGHSPGNTGSLTPEHFFSMEPVSFSTRRTSLPLESAATEPGSPTSVRQAPSAAAPAAPCFSACFAQRPNSSRLALARSAAPPRTRAWHLQPAGSCSQVRAVAKRFSESRSSTRPVAWVSASRATWEAPPGPMPKSGSAPRQVTSSALVSLAACFASLPFASRARQLRRLGAPSLPSWSLPNASRQRAFSAVRAFTSPAAAAPKAVMHFCWALLWATAPASAASGSSAKSAARARAIRAGGRAKLGRMGSSRLGAPRGATGPHR